MFEQFPLEERPRIQQSLARALRGVVAQVLLRKTGGGRLAARELLLNTPPVANLIAEGKTFQLPFALESGRKHGMVPLNDALAAFAAEQHRLLAAQPGSQAAESCRPAPRLLGGEQDLADQTEQIVRLGLPNGVDHVRRILHLLRHLSSPRHDRRTASLRPGSRRPLDIFCQSCWTIRSGFGSGASAADSAKTQFRTRSASESQPRPSD